jgi:hypothetical protein
MANGQNLGAFATRDLNLKENNYKGKSAGFATRLYAYGKDGLSFASINGGKPYVDNNTYSSRVICAFWKDERYTVAANLLAAAIERLETMAVPQRSFDCDVVDLAATNPEKYAELDFALFSRCILIDQTRSGAQIVHIIVERWIYPYLPQKNKVVLSTVPPRIQAQVTQIINSLNNQNSIYQQQQSSAQQNAIENATAQITGAKGGNMRAIYDSDGNWTELVVMNTESILTASKLWRFNLGGFGYSPYGYNGPYTTAITMDGAIVADFITTGTLDASRATVTNMNASNISTGTLAAARIAAHSLNVDKITGSLSGKGYPTDSNSWGINFQTGALTIGNVTAANITAGTLSADRIAANSIAVSKLTGSISAPGYPGDSNSWVLNLTDGTLTIGNITASNIKAGTLDASTVTVSNLNASNITAGTLSVDRINAKSITGAKIADNTITGGSSGNIAIGTLTGGISGGVPTGNIAAGTVLGGNIASSTITGGSSGNLSSSTITTDNTVSGINTNLGYAANYGTATAYAGSSGPSYFNCYQINCTNIVFKGAGMSLLWSDTLQHYYIGSSGED